MKRDNFIGKIHSILQEFNFANPLVTRKIFSTSFYGSNLWSAWSEYKVNKQSDQGGAVQQGNQNAQVSSFTS